jgi:glutamine amidotransferase-like uncharacterized protein
MKKQDNKQKTLIIFIVLTFVLASSIPVAQSESSAPEATARNPCYGFIINVTDHQSYGTQTNITRLLNKLLHRTAPVYWIANDITLLTQELPDESIASEHTFNKGSFLVSFGNNSSTISTTITLIYLSWLTQKISISKIMQPLTNVTAYQLVEPRIASMNLTSVDTYFLPWLLTCAGFEHLQLLTPQQILSNLTRDNYDVVLWGGQSGSYSEVISDILSPLGLHVRNTIRTYVKNGGGYIGICYGGWRAGSGYQRPPGFPFDLSYNRLLTFIPIQLNLLDTPVYRALPGWGRVTLTITNPSHPLTFGVPETINNLIYFGGPLFLNNTKKHSTTEPIAILTSLKTTSWDYDFMMDWIPFWNNKFLPDETKYRIAHQWMNNSIGATMWTTNIFGEGKVVAFGLHPEFTWGWDGNENTNSPPRIIYNSIWYTTASDPGSRSLENPLPLSPLTIDAGGPYNGTIDQYIQFNGSIQNGIPPYTWYWGFELPSDYYHDFRHYPLNDTQEGQHPFFNYSQPGTYKATLVVADASGNVGYNVTTVQIQQRIYD